MNDPNVAPMVAAISQLQDCRVLVSWAFSEQAKENPVSDVYKLADRAFAVAAVKSGKSKGVPTLEELTQTISDELSAMKKLEAIKEQIAGELKAGMSLQDMATKYSSMVADSVMLSYLGETYMNRGVENAAIGKMFGQPTTQNSVVTGDRMVYVYTLANTTPAPASPELQQEKSMIMNMLVGRNKGRDESVIINGLVQKMSAWDNRARFYTN